MDLGSKLGPQKTGWLLRMTSPCAVGWAFKIHIMILLFYPSKTCRTKEFGGHALIFSSKIHGFNISPPSIFPYSTPKKMLCFIELDDGNILTGKPDQFDGKKTHGFPVKIFPNKPIHWLLMFSSFPNHRGPEARPPLGRQRGATRGGLRTAQALPGLRFRRSATGAGREWTLEV